MAEHWDDLNTSKTAEVKAIIGRIDHIIGESHWPSVGNYKEGVIRRQIAEYLPKRYSVGTGFVLHEIGIRCISRQIDVLIWDSHNYGPIVQDGPFVVIHPQALRAAIEVKSTLTGQVLGEALENLDSLTPFIPILFERHRHDPNARHGFLRFVVAAESSMRFPEDIFNRLYRYYLRCIFDKDNPSDQHIQLSMDERQKLFGIWGLTPWISGVSVLGHGMVRMVHRSVPAAHGYVVSNDVVADTKDYTIGLVHRAIEQFLTTDIYRDRMKDFLISRRESSGPFMPMPFRADLQHIDNKFTPKDSLTWGLQDALMHKLKCDERKKNSQQLKETVED